MKCVPDKEYRDCMLTTTDNPYDPFTQFKSWFLYDVEKGYYSCGYLARICFISSEMTEDEINEAMEQAIYEIIRLDLTGKYTKVYRKEAVPA